VGKKDSIELLWPDAALLQSQCQLARAQTAIDQNIAVTGGNERAVSGAPASEHPQTEHAGCLIELPKIHKRKRENIIFFVVALCATRRGGVLGAAETLPMRPNDPRPAVLTAGATATRECALFWPGNRANETGEFRPTAASH